MNTLAFGVGLPVSLLKELIWPTWVRASERGPLMMCQKGIPLMVVSFRSSSLMEIYDSLRV